jgi:hypothetical protein
MTNRVAIVALLSGALVPLEAAAQFSSPGADPTATGGGSASTSGSASGFTNVEGAGQGGRFGLGFSSHARGAHRNVVALLGSGAETAFSSTGLGSLSAKYFATHRLAIEILVGLGIVSGTYFTDPLGRNGKVDTKGYLLSVGPRLLYSAVQGDNAELYLGGGVDVLYGDSSWDPEGPSNKGGYTMTGYVFYVPIGFEFAFPGVPSVRLFAETAVSYISTSVDFHQDDPNPGVEEEELGSATALVIGSPGLDFITLGLHYYF